jgi:hypothetical protein
MRYPEDVITFYFRNYRIKDENGKIVALLWAVNETLGHS